MSSKWRLTLMLVALIACFALPMWAASYLYHHAHAMKLKTTNKGRLITPPIPVGNLVVVPYQGKPEKLSNYKGKWLLVYLVNPSSSDKLVKHAYYLRQLKTSLGRDSDKIQPVILVSGSAGLRKPAKTISEKYPMVALLKMTNFTLDKFKGLLHSKAKVLGTQAVGSYYIIDPEGRLMMWYPQGTNVIKVLKDLTRLVKVSSSE